MTVKLRQRKKKHKISLYLDYYHQGKRSYEYLGLYLHPAPAKGRLSKAQKEENKETLALAENIRAKRQLQVQNRKYGFDDIQKLNASFYKYLESLIRKKRSSESNYNNWMSFFKYLKAYRNDDPKFGDIDKLFVESFKEYLDKVRNKNGKLLSQNTKYSYFGKFTAALKQAVKDGIINKNPADTVSGFKQDNVQREFLSLAELKLLANTECDVPVLKRAFLLSALTGLRFSDVYKLTWKEIQHSTENGNFIRYQQKKTKGHETLPISNSARELLGERGQDDEKVFKGLQYSAWYNQKLKEWVLRAGIKRSITFHSARHTFATLQLSHGTDIYTVSKLLGHKELKTTQIYAQVIDEKKREAVDKIKL